jgi:hypothetical protein
VISATARRAGLTYTKVVRFCEAAAMEKLVTPIAAR